MDPSRFVRNGDSLLQPARSSRSTDHVPLHTVLNILRDIFYFYVYLLYQRCSLAKCRLFSIEPRTQRESLREREREREGDGLSQSDRPRLPQPTSSSICLSVVSHPMTFAIARVVLVCTSSQFLHLPDQARHFTVDLFCKTDEKHES